MRLWSEFGEARPIYYRDQHIVHAVLLEVVGHIKAELGHWYREIPIPDRSFLWRRSRLFVVPIRMLLKPVQ